MQYEFWNQPPHFATGQILSAELQYNALRDSIDLLQTLYFFPYATQNTPILGRDGAYGWTPDDTFRVCRGVIKHKYPVFYYSISIKCGSFVDQQFFRFRFNNTALATILVSGTAGQTVVYQGTFSTASLTINTVYDFSLERTELIETFNIRVLEEQDSSSLAAVPALSTVPTANELNALSERTALLYDRAIGGGTTPVMIGYRHDGNDLTTQERGGMRAKIRHKQNSLFYYLHMRFPWIGHPSEMKDEKGNPVPGEGGTSDGSCWLDFKVNGTLLAKVGFAAHVNASSGNSLTFCVSIFRNGDVIELETGEWVLVGGAQSPDANGYAYSFNACTREYQGHKGTRPLVVGDQGDHAHHLRSQDKEAEPRGNWYPFRGLIDLSSLGLGTGEVYEVRIEEHDAIHNGAVRVANWTADVDVLYETASSVAALPGWQTMPEKNKDDAPLGGFEVMRQNLNLLRTYFVGRSPVSWAIRNLDLHDREIGAPYFVHRQPYLHYYVGVEAGWNEEEDGERIKPSIHWFNGKEWDSQELPMEDDKYNTWQRFDLLKLEKLYLGQHYRLHNVTYAFEDMS